VRTCRSQNFWGYWDPTILGWGTVDDLEIRHSPMCYHTKFCHFTSNSLGVGRGPKKFGDAGTRLLVTGAWLTPRNRLLCHMCYHTKFCHSRYNSSRVHMGVKISGTPVPVHPWDSSVTVPLETWSCLTHYHTKFCHSMSNHFDVRRESQNILGMLRWHRLWTKAWLTPRNALICHMCYHTNFVAVGQTICV